MFLKLADAIFIYFDFYYLLGWTIHLKYYTKSSKTMFLSPRFSTEDPFGYCIFWRQAGESNWGNIERSCCLFFWTVFIELCYYCVDNSYFSWMFLSGNILVSLLLKLYCFNNFQTINDFYYLLIITHLFVDVTGKFLKLYYALISSIMSLLLGEMIRVLISQELQYLSNF